MGSLGLGRWLERLVELLRFVVTEFRDVGSHEDPIRDQNYDSQFLAGAFVSPKKVPLGICVP